ncbi:uncharacterized protein LOC143459235 [Clavelina lepadiformis]|uniref:uncharacterized protein LOC143459235 n=1 Tax=Clavelina lepadiformis TaxID=159417 RepID=UPI004041AEDF
MSLQCKAKLLGSRGDEDEIRRFKVDQDDGTSAEFWTNKLKSLFPALNNLNFKMYWKDSEGDLIQFNTNEEVTEALSLKTGDVFNVTIKKSSKTQESASSSQSGGYAYPSPGWHNFPAYSSSFPRFPDPFTRAPGFSSDHFQRCPDPRWFTYSSMGPRGYPNPQNFGAQRFPSGFQGFSAGDPRFGCFGERDPNGAFSSS